MSNGPHIKFDSLTFGYTGPKKIYEALTLDISGGASGAGHVVALMGASGVGKSSLLQLMLGTLQPQQGSLSIYPQDAVVSFVPQEPVLFNHLSARENAAYFSTTKAFRSSFDHELFERLSIELDMQEVLKSNVQVSELSGGEKQRLMLLRALSIQPDILLLDEPTNALDPSTRLRFLLLLREVILKRGVLTIYCTHNRIECDLIADEIIFVNYLPVGGKKVFHAAFADFAAIPPTVEAYRAFKYPMANLLMCRIAEDGMLNAPGMDDSQRIFIGIEPDHLHFGDHGLPFTVAGSNPIYTQFSLFGQTLNLPAMKLPAAASHIVLNGEVLIYRADQSCAGKARVTNNQIRGYAV